MIWLAIAGSREAGLAGRSMLQLVRAELAHWAQVVEWPGAVPGSGNQPEMMEPRRADRDAEDGRQLQLVDRLEARWGGSAANER